MAPVNKRTREGQIFQAFLDCCPLFAGELVESWVQPAKDPPDVVCLTKEGQELGVELKSWVHESEIAAKKPRGDFFESVSEILEPQPPNKSKNILVVRYYPKDHVSRVRRQDQKLFRSEIYPLIEEIDNRWEPKWNKQPLGYYWQDFSSYPTLRMYLDGVRLYPKKGRFGERHDHPPWI